MSTKLNEELTSLLNRWADSEIDEFQVHDLAENLFSHTDWQKYGDEDPRSVPLELLSNLDIMNQQLITSKDIPAMLGFLALGEEQPTEAWIRWSAYWDKLDFESRKAELANHPFYYSI